MLPFEGGAPSSAELGGRLAETGRLGLEPGELGASLVIVTITLTTRPLGPNIQKKLSLKF